MNPVPGTFYRFFEIPVGSWRNMPTGNKNWRCVKENRPQFAEFYDPFDKSKISAFWDFSCQMNMLHNICSILYTWRTICCIWYVTYRTVRSVRSVRVILYAHLVWKSNLKYAARRSKIKHCSWSLQYFFRFSLFPSNVVHVRDTQTADS